MAQKGVYGLLLPYKDKFPKVAKGAFIAPGAVLVGDIEIGAGASVWYNCVLRGDVNRIRIDRDANVQDGTVIHVDRDFPTLIGENVLIGHLAMVHGCILEPGAFVGMKSTVMDGCLVESQGMVAAGALLSPGKRVGRGELWAGVPAKHRRDLTPEEMEDMAGTAGRYVGYAQAHSRSLGDMKE
jgi:carbonic anhydrase/acetyltransferase-like protein (isoleucine patch superfamily)